MSITTQQVSLRGELVETYEGHGNRVARIYLSQVQIDMPMQLLPEAHLGDQVILDATITVNSVSPCLRQKNAGDPD